MILVSVLLSQTFSTCQNAKQYYNQLYIDKNISLNLKNLDTKNIKIILNSLNEDVKVSLSSKDFDKKYELNKGINKIEISNDKLIKNLVISSQSKLLLSSIKISQDQISNGPWESRLIIEKKDIAKSINKLEIKNLINFKLKEKMLSNYNCENFSIISDNELFVYLKVDCQ